VARAILPGSFRLRAGTPAAGQIPLEGVEQAVRRYELMLVLKPDAPDERAAAVIDRTTRYVVASGGQIVKVAPWGRRRLAYPIDRYRDGSYHIVVFEAPAESIAEMERSLHITEDVLRYLVTRVVKPVKARRDAAAGDVDDVDADLPSEEDEEDEETGERIDESESEAAPAAID
jgi:small subunit ribosomal protein S6